DLPARLTAPPELARVPRPGRRRARSAGAPGRRPGGVPDQGLAGEHANPGREPSLEPRPAARQAAARNPRGPGRDADKPPAARADRLGRRARADTGRRLGRPPRTGHRGGRPPPGHVRRPPLGGRARRTVTGDSTADPTARADDQTSMTWYRKAACGRWVV